MCRRRSSGVGVGWKAQADSSPALCAGSERQGFRETDAMAVMMRSMLEVADNSGARKLQMILPLGGSTGVDARLGDIITAAVKEAAPEGQTKKGTVVKAVIVRTRKEY